MDAKPCPFCGNTDIKLGRKSGFLYNHFLCEKCQSSEPKEKWNSRPIEDALQAEIAKITADRAPVYQERDDWRVKAEELQVEIDRLNGIIKEREIRALAIALKPHELEDMVIEELKAEIVSLKKQLEEQEWRPIETAPKDGTKILVPDFVTSWDKGNRMIPGGWDGFDRWHQPTHWKPLPKPPSIVEGKGV